jgi:hypothetical protein
MFKAVACKKFNEFNEEGRKRRERESDKTYEGCFQNHREQVLTSAPVGEGKFPNIGKCLMKYPRDGVKNFD